MKTNILLCWLLICMACASSAFAQNSLDTTFNPGTGVDGFVESLLVQKDGKVLICGNFNSVNGVARHHIARLNNDGSVDTTFNASPGYWVRHMALQSDGKIVIGGFFKSVNGATRPRIARLNANGSLDSSFVVGTGCDGKIVPVDPTDPFVFAVAVQTDGKIIVGGNFTNYNGVARNCIARLNTDGSLDTSFNIGSGVNSWVRSIMIQPNGQIMFSGWFESYNNKPYNRMVRVNADGSADTGFNPYFGPKTAVYTMARLSSGKYIVAGHSVDPGPFQQEIARLNTDGTYDTSFNAGGPGADEKVESIAIQSDGKIVMVGYFGKYNGVERRGIARLFPDGTLDPSLVATSDNWLWTTKLQSDGKILVCGGMSTINGVSRAGIARLNMSGSATDTTVEPDTGSLHAWLMNGMSFVKGNAILSGRAVPLAWRVVGTGDVNGDGRNDVVWQNNNGAMVAWFLSGTNYLRYVMLPPAPQGWRANALGDLNGDGHVDILWRDANGRLPVWLMNRTNRVRTIYLRGGASVDSAWQVAALRDFNNDGSLDLLWQNTGRQLSVWYMNRTNLAKWYFVRNGQAATSGWHAVGAGDFNADGKTDVLWQYYDGRISTWFLNGTNYLGSGNFQKQPPNQNWKVGGVTDFDINHRDDILWRYMP